MTLENVFKKFKCRTSFGMFEQKIDDSMMEQNCKSNNARLYFRIRMAELP